MCDEVIPRIIRARPLSSLRCSLNQISLISLWTVIFTSWSPLLSSTVALHFLVGIQLRKCLSAFDTPELLWIIITMDHYLTSVLQLRLYVWAHSLIWTVTVPLGLARGFANNLCEAKPWNYFCLAQGNECICFAQDFAQFSQLVNAALCIAVNTTHEYQIIIIIPSCYSFCVFMSILLSIALCQLWMRVGCASESGCYGETWWHKKKTWH